MEHLSQVITPALCATELMETVPIIMQFIRAEMRGQSASLLSVPQFRVLAYLNRYPRASLSDMSEHLGVTRATASAMTERLVQRNFIYRVEHPQMRRQVMLTLTESGSAYLKDIRLMTQEKVATLLHPLTEEELLHVSTGLATLAKIFKVAVSDSEEKRE
ncbi:MarR family transcriptional regulator [Leptothermofonsia sp. ETS-13]|uniref:MarR family transcriptional regulator n=1 Tax=Leptothermofonsia sp. ETS-13 TaxID=3035696 RepID=UPI003BA04148